MRYEIEIRRRAEKDLALIPKSDAQNIADAIFAMENGLVGDIKSCLIFSLSIALESVIGEYFLIYQKIRLPYIELLTGRRRTDKL